jgi:hypothetical protein
MERHIGYKYSTPTVRYGFTKPDDKPIYTEEINVISAMEIRFPGRFSFKMSEPWVSKLATG